MTRRRLSATAVICVVALAGIVAAPAEAASDQRRSLVLHLRFHRVVLAICIVEPTAAQSAVKAIQAWTARHARAITLVVSFVVGGTLVIHGALTI